MNYNPRDSYFLRAKAEGYLARSVYKLKELDARYKLFRPGMRVVDLGAAPGSWTQYLLEKGGDSTVILAIDLQPLRIHDPRVQFLQMDVFSAQVEAFLAASAWDAILSDMAPATTGSRATDQARSAALAERSLYLAEKYLSPGGIWVTKLLEGPDRNRLVAAARQLFQEVAVFRPKSTRKGSSECFLIGRSRRP